MIPKIDSEIGILAYTTDFSGCGGTIRNQKADFNVSDRIKLSIQSTPVVHQAFDLHQDYILSETLTTEVVVSLSENQSVSGDFSGVKGKGKKAFAKQHNINGETTHIQIEQIAVPPSQRL